MNNDQLAINNKQTTDTGYLILDTSAVTRGFRRRIKLWLDKLADKYAGGLPAFGGRINDQLTPILPILSPLLQRIGF